MARKVKNKRKRSKPLPYHINKSYYQVTREDGLTEFVFLLDEQLEISGVGLISMNMAEQMVSNITEMSYRETAEKITEMTGQVKKKAGKGYEYPVKGSLIYLYESVEGKAHQA